MFTPQGTKIVSNGDEPLTVVNRHPRRARAVQNFSGIPSDDGLFPKGVGRYAPEPVQLPVWQALGT
jgi:hypothetical protein